MTIAQTLKTVLSGPSPSAAVAKLEQRAGEAVAALTAAGESQVAAQRELHDAEKAGRVADANKAAQKLSDLDSEIARLRVRKAAIASALAEARTEQGAADAAGRMEMFQTAFEQASKDADGAQHAAVVAALDLSRAIKKYQTASSAERAARDGISKCNGDFAGPSIGVRSITAVERAALLKSGQLSTVAFNLPNPAMA